MIDPHDLYPIFALQTVSMTILINLIYDRESGKVKVDLFHISF